ncbi:MAG TPA: hypothetical protein VJJ23_00950 [Candidatus Nanoarchaeia archaeon]|nr:hypothetical protein [Candidatus Nanoarchaeia archaeon]
MIADVKKELDSVKNKKEFLKQKLEEEKDAETRVEIRRLLVQEIKKDALVKLDINEPGEYNITYDSMSEGLEPIYFWLLDFMRGTAPTGLGLEVKKLDEAFEASVSSGYYGEMGSRASIMEDRAMKIMGTVNTVIRSIINLMYDLKEFRIRIDSYDDLKSDNAQKREIAEISLRGVWMDQVDIKHGRGSINGLAQQLQFVTLRDAFFRMKSVDQIDNLDLNSRVKVILKRKFQEYNEWRKYSGDELRKRYNIEKAYLKSQVESLKLYTKWARPYLIAAQKLRMREFNSPDIVNTFNNMQMEISLFGKKEVKPESVFEKYKKIKFKNKYYSCLEVEFKFRTVPQSLRTAAGSQYVHAGTTDMFFRGYMFTDEELKIIEDQEAYEGLELVEELTNNSLKEIYADMDLYLQDQPSEQKKKKEEKKKKEIVSIWNVFGGFKEVTNKLKEVFRYIGPTKTKDSFEVDQVKSSAKKAALETVLRAYDIYKKGHGMIAW